MNEVGVFGNRARRSASVLQVDGMQPACTSPESKVVPVCEPEASNTLGAWRSANVLTDHIALEAGFSKQAYQAQCVTVDCAGGKEEFVHVKNIHLVSSSCGWPENMQVWLARCDCH